MSESWDDRVDVESFGGDSFCVVEFFKLLDES